MPHNFYVVLGVSRDADLQQIKRAYRKLVKLYHPDAGGQPPEKFIEVQRAYEALRNEGSRQEHDRELVDQEVRPEPGSLLVRPSRKSAVARRREEPTLEEEIRGMFSAVDEFFSGWVPGFFTRGRQTARQKDLYVELILDPDEAAGGGLFPLQIPTETACRRCTGSGYLGELACQDCRGRGREVSYHEIEISVPPGVTDGTRKRLSLDDIGLNGVDLIVLVTVN